MQTQNEKLSQVPLPRPRFALPLSREDQIVLLCFSEALANLYAGLLERTCGEPVPCTLVDEIRDIVARAEFAARVDTLQALEPVEEAA